MNIHGIYSCWNAVCVSKGCACNWRVPQVDCVAAGSRVARCMSIAHALSVVGYPGEDADKKRRDLEERLKQFELEAERAMGALARAEQDAKVLESKVWMHALLCLSVQVCLHALLCLSVQAGYGCNALLRLSMSAGCVIALMCLSVSAQSMIHCSLFL